MTKGAFALGVVTTAVALNLLILVNDFPLFLGVDLSVFARVHGVPVDQLYEDTSHTPFIYPPTAILPFMAVAWLPYAAFIALSVAAFILALPDKRVAAVSLLSHAAFKGLYLGQIPMLLAAGVFAGLRIAPFLGGMLWGVIASIKPQLMLFAPLALLVRRDWQMLIGMCAGAGLSLIAAMAAFGADPWFEWYSTVVAFTENKLLIGVAVKSITPAGLFAVAGLPTLPLILFGASLGTVAIFLACREADDVTLVGLIVATSGASQQT